MSRNSLPVRPRFHLPQLIVVATLSTGFAVADPASGPLADPFSTLVSLDAQQLADPSTGAHFSGSGGERRHWSANTPRARIEVGPGPQNVHQQTPDGITGLQALQSTFPAHDGVTSRHTTSTARSSNPVFA